MSGNSSNRSSAAERVNGGLHLATLPNLLSLIRIVLLAPILVLLHRPTDASQRWALVLLLIAGLTDLLDGSLARHRGSVSPSGKVFDPIADKVLIGGIVLYLAAARGFPVWLVVALFVRDLALVAAAWFILRTDRVVFAANWSGKLTTFAIGILILAYFVRWEPSYLALTVFATMSLLASYVSYGHRAISYFAHRGSSGRGQVSLS